MQTVTDWINLFNAVAKPTLALYPLPRTTGQLTACTDEAGNRRPILHLLLARESGLPAPDSPDSPDLLLWKSIGPLPPPVDSLFDLSADAAAPLLKQTQDTIEVFSEAELCCLHAMWNLADQHHQPRWRVRCLHAAAWLIENIQPDNATNYPWAAHVFAAAAGAPAFSLRQEAAVYARTLVHNCQIMLGRADWLSALVLQDAARSLQRGSADRLTA